MNPTASLVRELRRLLHKNSPPQFHEPALLFLSLIGDNLFNIPEDILQPDQVSGLYEDWAAAVDSVHHTNNATRVAIFAVLVRMISPPRWRPYIATEKLRLLEYFTIVPDDFEVWGALDDQGLIEAIRGMQDSTALITWLKILWLKYKRLIPEVQKQLRDVTRALSPGGADLRAHYLSVINSELELLEGVMGASVVDQEDYKAAFAKTLDLKLVRGILVAL